MREARREGTKAASAATPATTKTTTPNVSGSDGVTPKSRPDSARPKASREHGAVGARDRDDNHRLRHELRDDRARQRAERQAQANLAPAQAHDIAQRAVQTEARERECRAGEQREHDRSKAVLRVRVADLLLE